MAAHFGTDGSETLRLAVSASVISRTENPIRFQWIKLNGAGQDVEPFILPSQM